MNQDDLLLQTVKELNGGNGWCHYQTGWDTSQIAAHRVIYKQCSAMTLKLLILSPASPYTESSSGTFHCLRGNCWVDSPSMSFYIRDNSFFKSKDSEITFTPTQTTYLIQVTNDLSEPSYGLCQDELEDIIYIYKSHLESWPIKIPSGAP